MQGNRHWIVLGPGAISGLIASGLCDQRESVSVLARYDDLAKAEWQLIGSDTKKSYSIPSIQSPIQENSVFIVAVKAFDVVHALRHIIKLDGFHETMPIVISHNGMVILPEDLSHLNLHPLVTTHGAVKTNNDTLCIEHRGAGRSWLEVKQEHSGSEPWPTLQQAFPPLILEQDLSHRRWLKLIINCVINPLTAVHQCANGALLNDEWQPQIYRLVAEAVAVAESQNLLLETEECYQEVLRVAEETSLNHSSMLQDIKQQRRTEIEQLTGYLTETGESAGIATPTHHQLLEEFQQRYLR